MVWPNRKRVKSRRVFGGYLYRLDHQRLLYFRHKFGIGLSCFRCEREFQEDQWVVNNRGGNKKGKLYHRDCWFSMFI